MMALRIRQQSQFQSDSPCPYKVRWQKWLVMRFAHLHCNDATLTKIAQSRDRLVRVHKYHWTCLRVWEETCHCSVLTFPDNWHLEIWHFFTFYRACRGRVLPGQKQYQVCMGQNNWCDKIRIRINLMQAYKDFVLMLPPRDKNTKLS